MPWKHSGKTIYKENPDGSKGKKVGKTKGDPHKYLAALYANMPKAEKGVGRK